jgi:hypothetical protein
MEASDMDAPESPAPGQTLSGEPSKPVPEPEKEPEKERPKPVAAPKGARVLKAITPKASAGTFQAALLADGAIGSFKVYYLEGPPRVVLDLPGSWSAESKTLPPARGDLVGKIRIGTHPDLLRVVFDLKTPGPPKTQVKKTKRGLTLSLTAK